jgi:ribosomal subunit interface protein
MDVPLQIRWRGIAPSPAIEAVIRERTNKLESFYDHIVSCRVVVEAPHHHHHQGNLFHVAIDIKVPGKEIVVGRGPAEHQAHQDMYVALRDAFDAAKRQLQDHSRVQRGDIKQHDEHHVARVIRRFPAQGFGFLGTADGREIYFHRNAVEGADFDELDEGTEVWFVEEQGEKGPQAKRVTIGKHHPPAS